MDAEQVEIINLAPILPKTEVH